MTPHLGWLWFLLSWHTQGTCFFVVCWFLYVGDGPPPSPDYSVGSSKGARHTKPGVFSPGVVVFSCFSSLIMEELTRRGESKQISEKEQDPDRATHPLQGTGFVLW